MALVDSVCAAAGVAAGVAAASARTALSWSIRLAMGMDPAGRSEGAAAAAAAEKGPVERVRCAWAAASAPLIAAAAVPAVCAVPAAGRHSFRPSQARRLEWRAGRETGPSATTTRRTAARMTHADLVCCRIRLSYLCRRWSAMPPTPVMAAAAAAASTAAHTPSPGSRLDRCHRSTPPRVATVGALALLLLAHPRLFASIGESLLVVRRRCSRAASRWWDPTRTTRRRGTRPRRTARTQGRSTSRCAVLGDASSVVGRSYRARRVVPVSWGVE